MTDSFTRTQRSHIMRQVRGKDTTPEIVVRRLVHRLGFRYRLHADDLPGKPDLVFPSRGKVIFVHGCFWHQHSCARGDRMPGSNRDYWLRKLAGNKRRDRRHRAALKRAGWKVLIVWECHTKNLDKLAARLADFLDD